MSDYARGIIEASHGEIFIGKNLIVFPVIGTTMAFGNERIREGKAKIGETIIALVQTNGMTGTPGKPWKSAPGNLAISRLLEIGPCRLGYHYGILASLAARDVIRDLLPTRRVVLRSPNDIMLEGAKVGGSLVEEFYDMAGVRDAWRFINIGLGVNLEMTPKGVSQNVTCLKDHGCSIGIAAFLDRFDEKLKTLLSSYHEHYDFNGVLDHMEVLRDDGTVTVEDRETGALTIGKYVGLDIDESFDPPLFSMKLQNRGTHTLHPVRKSFLKLIDGHQAHIPEIRFPNKLSAYVPS